jgi:hypothetical protein
MATDLRRMGASRGRVLGLGISFSGGFSTCGGLAVLVLAVPGAFGARDVLADVLCDLPFGAECLK